MAQSSPPSSASVVQALTEAHRQVSSVTSSTSSSAVAEALDLLRVHAPRLPASWFTPAFIDATLALASTTPQDQVQYGCIELWASWLRKMPAVGPLDLRHDQVVQVLNYACNWATQTCTHLTQATTTACVVTASPSAPGGLLVHWDKASALVLLSAVGMGKVWNGHSTSRALNTRLGTAAVHLVRALSPHVQSHYYLDSLLASIVHLLLHCPADVDSDSVMAWHQGLLQAWVMAFAADDRSLGTSDNVNPSSTKANATTQSRARDASSPMGRGQVAVWVGQMYGYLWAQLSQAAQSTRSSPNALSSSNGSMLGWKKVFGFFLPNDTDLLTSDPSPSASHDTKPIGFQRTFPASEHCRLLLQALSDTPTQTTQTCNASDHSLAMALRFSVIAALWVADQLQRDSHLSPGTGPSQVLTSGLEALASTHLQSSLASKAMRFTALPASLVIFGLSRMCAHWMAKNAVLKQHPVFASLNTTQRIDLLHWVGDYLLGHRAALLIDTSIAWQGPKQVVHSAPTGHPLLYQSPLLLADRLHHPLFKQLPHIITLYRGLLVLVDSVDIAAFHVSKWASYAHNLFVLADQRQWLDTGALQTVVDAEHQHPALKAANHPLGVDRQMVKASITQDTNLGVFCRTILLGITLIFKAVSQQFMGSHRLTMRSSQDVTLALDILDAYAQLAPFVISLYGHQGFPTYQQVCHTVLEAITDSSDLGPNHTPPLADQLIRHLHATCWTVLDQADSRSRRHSPTATISYARQLRHLYFLQTCEILVPCLGASVIQACCLPLVEGYLFSDTGPYARALLEVSHRVVLSILEADGGQRKDLIALSTAIAPFYDRVLFETYPRNLEFSQLRTAYTLLIQQLMQYQPALAWAVLDRLMQQLDQQIPERNQSLESAPLVGPSDTHAGPARPSLASPASTSVPPHRMTSSLLRHGQYLQLLTDQVASVPFPYFSQRLLPKIRWYVLQEPNAVAQMSALKSLHQSVLQSIDVGKKEVALKWLLALEHDVTSRHKL
ncbi:hypothetical protein H4R35_005672 [Dimargaris xerosporica]|nr:hypothetical protein H4R35_005672 [Dimargaris xerosporica]